jgi:dGTPase
MNRREQREELEHMLIGPNGICADQSRGRALPEDPDEVRTCFQRDVDRITHSKAFRRLKHKTQVFLQPEGDHYRTRLTHTLEVSRIARTIARALRLNEDLAEAISLGHDLGHTPFGHAGERALNEIFPDGFKHYEQSLRVVDVLEKDGQGLNLCYETRMGILHHKYSQKEDTMEAKTVYFADSIAFLNHDLDDSIRAGILTPGDVPEEVRRVCGERNSLRINAMVTDVIENSTDTEIRMSPEMQKIAATFKKFMFSDVYTNPKAKKEETKVQGILASIYDHYLIHPDQLPPEYLRDMEVEGPERAVCDYVAGMTDSYAIHIFTEIYIPTAWSVM